MDEKPTIRHRWFAFSLRSLFAWMTIAALAVAYIAREQLQSRREQAIVAAWQPHITHSQILGLCDVDDRTGPCGFGRAGENDAWWRRSISTMLGTRVRQLGLNSLPDGDLSPLSDLTHLESLELYHVPTANFAPLAKLKNLRTLELGGTNIRDLSPLAGLDKLQFLSLNGTSVRDLLPLAHLPNLRALYLTGTNVRDLTPLGSLTQLETLFLDGTQVEELEPLANIKTLAALNIARTRVADLSPLADSSNLQMLDISGLTITFDQFNQLQRHLPKCKIEVYGPDGAASATNPDVSNIPLLTP